MQKLLKREDIPNCFAGSDWRRILFSEFEATLTSKSRPFPCVFGVTGFKADQLRFAFLDPFNAEEIAPVLHSYLSQARQFGRMTSLVLFARPGPVRGIEDYRNKFWSILDDLERLDETPRPTEIARDLDSDKWEFCFAGEPIFVVCNTPAHVLRQSRRSTAFMITFQPRWVFDGIMDKTDPAQARALDLVRDRLGMFDAIDPAPYLGQFGDPDNREFQQYFLGDSNETPKCPFHQLGITPETERDDKGEVA